MTAALETNKTINVSNIQLFAIFVKSKRPDKAVCISRDQPARRGVQCIGRSSAMRFFAHFPETSMESGSNTLPSESISA